MNLSTSSSSHMLIKTSILALCGFLLYSIALNFLPFQITEFQNQWIKNYAVAEKYIYKKQKPRAVIVGSSMSERLLVNNEDEEIDNIAMSGGSALTGLQVIKESKHVPDAIFIEANLIEQSSNKEMLSRLFTPVVWKAKDYLMPLQYTYQPVNIFLTVMKRYFGRSHATKMQMKQNSKIFENSLVRHQKNNRTIEGLYDSEQIRDVTELVNYFDGLGVEVIFYQVPVHSSILKSEKYQVRKKILISHFSDAQFLWIDEKDADKYITTDGIHLLYKSADEYSKALSKFIHKNLKKE